MTRTVFAAFLLVPLAAGLFAQGAPLPTYMVPATREPHHNVKLDNALVRILDVTVAPFDGTLYHIHENPYVYVSIGAATLKAQVEGSNDIIDLNLKDGEVRYSPAVTHRVGNIGATPFRNITVQIQGRDTTPLGAAGIAGPPKGAAAAGIDNELVRMDRLTLGPGESTGSHPHARAHLLIAVHAATVKMDAQGYPTTQTAMKPGDFDWHTGPYTHTLTNAGTTPFEAIEVVWK